MALSLQLRAVWLQDQKRPALEVLMREPLIRATRAVLDRDAAVPMRIEEQGLPKTIAALAHVWTRQVVRRAVYWGGRSRGRTVRTGAGRISRKLHARLARVSEERQLGTLYALLIAPITKIEMASNPDLREFYMDYTLAFGRAFPDVELTVSVEDALLHACRFMPGGELRIED